MSLRVDGEVEGEAVEVTFSKGARQKILRRQCWTATDVRLMWADQANCLALVFVTKETHQLVEENFSLRYLI